MDGRTDGPTDRRTDKAGCRVACTRLKSNEIEALHLISDQNVIGDDVKFLLSHDLNYVPQMSEELDVDQIFVGDIITLSHSVSIIAFNISSSEWKSLAFYLYES